MSDDDNFVTEVTGGYNPGSREFFLNLRAEGANILIKLDDIADEGARERLQSMINDLPQVAAEVTGKMLGEITEKLDELLSNGGEFGVEAPRATIYSPGSLE